MREARDVSWEAALLRAGAMVVGVEGEVGEREDEGGGVEGDEGVSSIMRMSVVCAGVARTFADGAPMKAEKLQ